MLNIYIVFPTEIFIFYIEDKYEVCAAPTTTPKWIQDINPKFKFYVFQDFIKRNKDKTRQLKVHAKCMKIM